MHVFPHSKKKKTTKKKGKTMSTKKQRQAEQIKAHGENLLAIFPNATERDPLTLCKKLRRIEVRANRAACDACNHQAGADAWEAKGNKARAEANAILGTDRVWVNGDPRGYALKVDLRDGENLRRDWGGYGIIAPEITGD
jgi:hypothetical protein